LWNNNFTNNRRHPAGENLSPADLIRMVPGTRSASRDKM